MPENTQVTSNRERYTKRLKEKYPDREFADDEALFAQINDDYDVYDEELSGYREREKSLSDLFASNPRSAAFLTDWRNGEDPLLGMIRKFGDDFKAALEDPEKQEALAAANKEYADRIAKETEYEAVYQKNITATLAEIEKAQAQHGLSDEDVDKVMDFLINIMRDGLMGKFTSESMEMALKALNYDLDIQQAGHEGEIKGRNERIIEKLRKGAKGDGTASLSGKNGQAANKAPLPDMGAIDRYDSTTKNIWERGGEKRRSYK